MITSGGRTVIGRRRPRNFNFVHSNHFSDDYIFLQFLVSQLREYKPRIINSTQQIPLGIVFRLVPSQEQTQHISIQNTSFSSDFENNKFNNNWIHKGRLEVLFVNRTNLNSSSTNWELPDLFVCKEDIGLHLDNEFSYRLIGRLDDRTTGLPSQVVSSYVFLQLPTTNIIDKKKNNSFSSSSSSYRSKWVSVRYLRDIIFAKPEPRFSQLSTNSSSKKNFLVLY